MDVRNIHKRHLFNSIQQPSIHAIQELNSLIFFLLFYLNGEAEARRREERRGRSHASFAKELLAGGFAKTVVAPLERVKILFQVPQDSYFTSYSFYSFSSFGGRG